MLVNDDPMKPERLIAAYEMMVETPTIANLICKDMTKRIETRLTAGRKHGMFLLDESLDDLWRNSKCEPEEVLLRPKRTSQTDVQVRGLGHFA